MFLAICKWEDYLTEIGINNFSFHFGFLQLVIQTTETHYSPSGQLSFNFLLTFFLSFYDFLLTLWMNNWRKKFHWNLSLHNDCREFVKAQFFFTPKTLSRCSITTQVAEKLHFFLFKCFIFCCLCRTESHCIWNLFPIQTLEELKQSLLFL